MRLREQKMSGGWSVDLYHDGRSISRLWIADRQMRIGSSTIKIGGIAGVGTDAQYRKQGLASRVLHAAIELMQREDYDASFLYGIADFYHRFGFVTCMPQHSLELDTRRAERAEKRLRLRPARKADYPTIARIYNRDSAERTASCQRDVRRWYGFPMGSGFGVPCTTRVVIDTAKKVVGYVAYDDVETHCRIAEVGGQGADVFHALLHDMARRAVALRRSHFSLSLPPDHPFALFCRSYGCTAHTAYERNAGPMARLINLSSCMENVRQELARRWGETDRQRSLTLQTDLGHSTLSWRDDQLCVETTRTRSTARLGQTALTQLLLGYATPNQLRTSGDLTCSATQLALLERLFPLQQAHMSWPDRF